MARIIRMSTKIDKEIDAFIRAKLEERLAQITPEQKEFFYKLFPNKVPKDKLKIAIDLCDRTIAKNLKE